MKSKLLWTMCVVRGAKASRREIHFNTIVRDLFPDCLTKFDCNLITAEWPTVMSVSAICAVSAFKSLHMLVNSVSTDWHSRKPAVAAVEAASLMMSMTLRRNQAKPQEIKKQSFALFLHSFNDVLSNKFDNFVGWQNGVFCAWTWRQLRQVVAANTFYAHSQQVSQ